MSEKLSHTPLIESDQNANSDTIRQQSSARAALRSELQKRRPSPHIVRSTCKSGLNGRIPDELRSEVWLVLLGVDTKDRFLLDDSIRETKLDLHNQRVIRVDTDRTRADLPLFRTEEMKALVSKILTFYCKRRGIKYKQGLNELLAPFILLRSDPRLPDGIIFNLYYAFIEMFLPHMFSDIEFNALQCEFRLFRLIIQYHDPELCHLLDQYQLVPELYATPWFLTLFARNVRLDLLFKIWDTYLLEEGDGGRTLHIFCCAAFLLGNRDILMRTHSSDLPMLLTSVLGATSTGRRASVDSESQSTVDKDILEMLGLDPNKDGESGILMLSSESSVDAVMTCARKLRNNTPRALSEILFRTLFSSRGPTSDHLERIEQLSCLYISPVELGKHQLSFDAILLDCRPKEKFEMSHMKDSIHIDPRLLSSPEHLNYALNKIQELGQNKKHYAVLGDETEAPPMRSKVATMLILHLLQRGFKYVSLVEGSWPDLRESLRRGTTVCGPSVVQLHCGDFENEMKRIKPPTETQESWFSKLKTGIEQSKISESFQSLSVTTISNPKEWFGGIDQGSETAKAHKNSGEGSKASDVFGNFTSRLSQWIQPPDSTDTVNKKTDKMKSTDRRKGEVESNRRQEVESLTEAEWQNEVQWVDLKSWTNSKSKGGKSIRVFDARKVSINQNMPDDFCVGRTCVLAVTDGYLVELTRHSDRPEFVRIHQKYAIGTLTKITSRKSLKNLIVLHFSEGLMDEDEIKCSYVVENSRACIDLVKKYYTSNISS